MAVREYFWGAELNENKKTAVWDPEADDKDAGDDSSGITHFLFLKQAALGLKAKDGERNVIEVEAEDFDGNSIKQPLFSLKMGLKESTVLDIGAQPPLTLRLLSGSGPVHVSGQHALELNEDDMDMLDDEAEEAVESPVKGASKNQAKKRPASSTDGPAKKAKLSNSEGKNKVGALKDEEDSDSEDDEDFDPDLGDDSDDDLGGESDEEDEDDESDMEEGTPDKTQKKGEKVNGAGPKKPKTKGEAEPKSLDKIKQELKKSPSKPKKRNKFANFIKSQYKVTDDKTVEELWTWYKESIIS